MSEKPKDPKTKLTLWLPPDLIREAKKRAIDEGKSMSRIVADLLEKWAREQDRQECAAAG